MATAAVDAGANMTHTEVAISIGEIQLGFLDSGILLIAMAAALLSALSLWRIGQSEDRQNRLLSALRRTPHTVEEPPQATRNLWYHQLGTLVAATRLMSTPEQRRLLGALVAAGVKGHGHLSTLVTAKVCGAALFVPLCWLLLEWRHFWTGAASVGFLVLAGAAFLGWRSPEVILSRLAARRRLRLESGMPDALDLLVICAEAGLSLDQAIALVGRVLRHSRPEVAEEFAATAAEMRVSPVRGQALENLAQRVGLASLHGIVSALNQSLKFGTPLTDSLRVLAAEMRAERLARFEERAARLPVLLTLPLMGFILPSLMIVIGTPLALRITDMLGRGP